MKKTLIVAIILSSITLNLFSQDIDNQLLKKLVDKNILTQAEAEEIQAESVKEEEKPSFVENMKKIRQDLNTPYLKFGGYGLLMYEYAQYTMPHHSMKPRLLFLSMNGNLSDHLRYSILMDFATPMLFEYYAEWMPSKAFNLRGGQFKVPLTFENQISLTDLETIANTRSVSSLAGMGYDLLIRFGGVKNGAGRDIGIQVAGSLVNTGDHDLIQYAAGIFQGAGINAIDNNDAKDFSGTLILQPIKGLRLGAGLYAGTAHYTSLGNNVTEGDHVRDRWTIGLDYKKDRFYARTEWLHGNDGGIKEEGLYGTALWYFIPQKFNVVGKLDYYNENKSIHSTVVDYTVGLNYYFAYQCRLQLNYTYSDYAKAWNARSANSILAQMQIVF